MSKNIVFVDRRVNNYQVLIDGLRPDSDWVLLEPEQDGVLQMQAALLNYSELDAIHIIFHGSAGTLYLGSTVLDSERLASYSVPLSSIGSSLTDTGDILLYGCSVAQGDLGGQFITSLAQYTGADVAASSNVTGVTALGGDWALERATGGIEAASAIESTLSYDQALAFQPNQAPIFGSTQYQGSIVPTVLGHTNGRLVSVHESTAGVITATGSIVEPGVSWKGMVTRFKPDGTFDSNFSDDGLLYLVYQGRDTFVNDGITLDDGSTLVGGSSFGGTAGNSPFIARVSTTGQLDSGFGQHGFFSPSDSTESMRELAVNKTNGIIYAAGWFSDFSTGSAVTRSRIYSVNSNGTANTQFGSNGEITLQGSSGYVDDLDVGTNGTVFITVDGGGGPHKIFGFGSDGMPLSSFGAGGIVLIDTLVPDQLGQSSIAIDTKGSIYLASNTWRDGNPLLSIVKLGSDGTLDGSYGDQGRATGGLGIDIGWEFGSPPQIMVDESGSVSVLTTIGKNGLESAMLTKFDPSGVVEMGFGSTGTSLFSLGEPSASALHRLQLTGLSSGNNGATLVSGSAWDGDSTEMAIARINSTGQFDPNFSGPVTDTSHFALNYISGYPFAFLSPSIGVSDPELAARAPGGDYGGASLHLERRDAGMMGDDVQALGRTVLLDSQGLNGGKVLFDGDEVGDFVRGEREFTITFAAGTTGAQVNGVLRSIAFRSDENVAQFTLDWVFSDGSDGNTGTIAASASAVTTVNVSTSEEGTPYWVNSMFFPASMALIRNQMDGTNIYYVSFPSVAPSYLSSEQKATFVPVSTTQVETVRAVLQIIESFTNIKFIESGIDLASRTLSFFNANRDSEGPLYAYLPGGDPINSDVSLGFEMTTGLEGYSTYHEIGHALGLKHPHTTPAMPIAEDNGTNTVMTYTLAVAGFKVFDVAALQYIYGPNHDVRGGADTYYLGATTSQFIWDGAGFDTVDGSDLSLPITIYLEPGHWNFVGSRGTGITSPGQFTINYGTEIEAFIGGHGEDVVYGNALNNTLDGGLGDVAPEKRTP